ncbi:hypothetical protein [Cryobacterium sp. HLT2-28]|uniref:hypothetical protein n=1 Tax=Cryobacterium sp. HLT2-28 TaxID=1259146 RepID=UPI001069EE0B|nr:hypothetical protein [Cryobacterium sp. HLT2-28]TFB94935.1 hypothetical protein E3O48_07045 [Cryobacterium sp. HLT2-28]
MANSGDPGRPRASAALVRGVHAGRAADVLRWPQEAGQTRAVSGAGSRSGTGPASALPPVPTVAGRGTDAWRRAPRAAASMSASPSTLADAEWKPEPALVDVLHRVPEPASAA